MSERQILITYDQPNWDEEDHDWLAYQIKRAVSQESPSEHYTIQEFSK